MKYLVVDGMAFGTGIRDAVNGGFLDLEELSIPKALSKRIKNWLVKYEDEHYNNYSDIQNIKKLDEEGLQITQSLKEELKDCKVEYYSNALMKKITGKQK